MVESSSLYTVIVPVATETLLRIARMADRTVRSSSVSVPLPVLSNFLLSIASAICIAVGAVPVALEFNASPVVPAVK